MWNEIIRKLLSEGRTQRQLAAEVGCTQATISRLCSRKSVQPMWAVGHRLMQLADKQCQCAVHDNQEAA